MSLPTFDDPHRARLLLSLSREFWATAGRGPSIMQALMQRDWAAVRHEAHILKGTAGILGVPHVSLLAAALERAVAGEAPDLNHAIHVAADLNTAMAGVLRAVLCFHPSPDLDPTVGPVAMPRAPSSVQPMSVP